MFRSSQSCSAASGRGRVVLFSAVAVFLCVQLGLDVALNTKRPLRDPEYGRRLESLQRHLAERAPVHQLVLFMGSSRIGTTIHPDVITANQSPVGGGPVVFNYGICNSGPIIEMLTLRRLLADGIHPDCVFIEVYPWIDAWPAAAQMRDWPHERLLWDDLGPLQPYTPTRKSDARMWMTDHILPWLSLRTHLLNQWAPQWVAPDRRNSANWDGLDNWGWLKVPAFTNDDGQGQMRIDHCRLLFVPDGERFTPCEASVRAFKELLALCKSEKITAVLVTMPDYFASDYSPAARERMDDFMRGQSLEHDAPFIDARTWASAEDYFDGAHLTQVGGAVFTRRFDRDVLQPYLRGEPLDRAWPPGRLNAVSQGP